MMSAQRGDTGMPPYLPAAVLSIAEEVME